MFKDHNRTATLALACSLAIGAHAPSSSPSSSSRCRLPATSAPPAMETCKAQGYNVSVHSLGIWVKCWWRCAATYRPHTMENSMAQRLDPARDSPALRPVCRRTSPKQPMRRTAAWQHDPGARRPADQGQRRDDRAPLAFPARRRRQGTRRARRPHRQGRRSVQ